MDPVSVELLKGAVRRPLGVATLFPTSRALATRLTREVALVPGAVAELGAGSGAITRVLAPRVPGRLVAIEIDPESVRFLRRTFPDVRVVCGPAQELGAVAPPGSLGAVVASLPWTLLPAEAVERVLTAVRRALAPHGVFATYLCLNALLTPRAHRVLERMRAIFPRVETRAIEWRNLPPALPVVARVGQEGAGYFPKAASPGKPSHLPS